MKTPATILLLFLLTLTAPGSDIGEIHRIGNGLIGWYLLPGHFTASKAFDASQKANHSSGCGGTVSHTGTRDVLNMNGTSAQYITIPNQTYLVFSNKAFSICHTLNCTTNNNRTFFSKETTTTTGGWTYWMNAGSQIVSEDNQGNYAFDGTQFALGVTATSCFEYTPNTAWRWIDGPYAGTAALGVRLFYGSEPLRIGATNGKYYFQGWMANFMIFDHLLSATERNYILREGLQ